MRAIIFGASGQDGFYLSVYLKSLSIEVVSVSRTLGDIVGDVSDAQFVKSCINIYKPQYIFHLAANSTTQHEVMYENEATISMGTINILEAVRVSFPDTKVFLSGSAMQFRNYNKPINEKNEFHPSSPYAISRINSVLFARYFRDKYNLKIYIGYFFNHDSPLRKPNHINQKIVNAVVRIKNGDVQKLRIGNINVQKEFSFAGDIVKAVWMLVNQDRYFEAVIGSGKAYSIKNWVEYCFKKEGLVWEDYVVNEEEFISEYDVLVSDPALIKSIGWQPEVGFFQLADMMLAEAKKIS